MDPIQLSTGFKDQGFALPQSFEVSAGDTIIFKAVDASFEVIFPKAEKLFTNVNTPNAIKSYPVTEGQTTPTDTLKSVLPLECEFMVRRTDIDEATGKAPAKMTVKAVISRNG